MNPTRPEGPGRAGRSRLLRRLLLAAGFLVALSLLTALGLTVWKASVDRQLDANWRRSFGGASILERYPATRDNATVLDLETLGAAIGIEMAPADTPGRIHPTPEAAKRFEAIRKSLTDFFNASKISTGEPLAPLPPELSAFLESVRPNLDTLRARLAQGPPPVWARDLEAGFETRIPNYLGVLMLQKLLLLKAREQLRTGREAQAGEILETSWRLNQAVADNSPGLITQLIAQAVIRIQQPILRNFPRTPAGWPERLRHLDQQSRILQAMRCEAFSAHVTSTFNRPIQGMTLGPKAQAFARWMIWDYARRFSAILEELPHSDVRSFDPAAFEREQRTAIPRWQVVARTLLPNFWDVWPKSAHVELEAELTALVLEERDRLAAGGPLRSADRRSSRVKGLSWIYEDVPGGTTVHLDGELRSKEIKPVPLWFTVRRVP